MDGFEDFFCDLPDPRAANALHNLTDILFIALAASLCGAETCVDMAVFAQAKEPLLRQILPLKHGLPSHDTFSRVFRMLDPEAFEAAFTGFMRRLAQPLKGVVALDGKAVRRAYERGRRSTPLHLVNVFACEARLCIAQRLAPNRNEVAGAIEVLRLLSLGGCVVTADALHCHAAMAEAILDQGADYALVVKENQAALLKDAKALFADKAKGQSAARADPPGHDRREERHVRVLSAKALGRAHAFPGLAAVAELSLRQHADRPDEPPLVRHVLLSKRFAPKRVLDIVRAHWGVENNLHWVLDVVFREDEARNRKDHGPQNLSLIRKLALNLLRLHPQKLSIRAKKKRAGWEDAFLLDLLAHMR